MFCDISRALTRAEAAIAEMKLARQLDAAELDGVAFTLATCRGILDKISGDCLLPLNASALPAIHDPHARAVSALRHASERLAQARPLRDAGRRGVHGLRFMLESVLVVLEAHLPDSHPATVRFSIVA